MGENAKREMEGDNPLRLGSGKTESPISLSKRLFLACENGTSGRSPTGINREELSSDEGDVRPTKETVLPMEEAMFLWSTFLKLTNLGVGFVV
jgi:hypothetical protein